MKRKALFSSIVLLSLLSLPSCFRSGKNMCTNYFVPGEFTGMDEKDPSRSYLFHVSEISQQEYADAEGLNVVNDYVLEAYFSIELTIVTEVGSTPYNFVNMEEAWTTKDFPISYHDDNQTWITPHRDKQDSPWNYREHFYLIEITDLDAYVFFDPVEGEDESKETFTEEPGREKRRVL